MSEIKRNIAYYLMGNVEINLRIAFCISLLLHCDLLLPCPALPFLYFCLCLCQCPCSCLRIGLCFCPCLAFAFANAFDYYYYLCLCLCCCLCTLCCGNFSTCVPCLIPAIAFCIHCLVLFSMACIFFLLVITCCNDSAILTNVRGGWPPP